MPDEVRLPKSNHRIAIMGHTGSGKTVAGVWHLSMQGFDQIPWVIIDFKTDELINSIPNARHIELSETPKKPGIYIVHPLPHEIDAVDDFLWKIWGQQNTGVYVDEGYMVGRNGMSPAFNALLTQGRSRRIPVITLTQRPVLISRFVFSEANFFQVFNLNDKRDYKTVEAFASSGVTHRLPDYHSFYFDVGRNRLHRLKPVPGEAEILERIESKLKPIRRTL